jgi:hypothetical protein
MPKEERGQDRRWLVHMEGGKIGAKVKKRIS